VALQSRVSTWRPHLDFLRRRVHQQLCWWRVLKSTCTHGVALARWCLGPRQRQRKLRPDAATTRTSAAAVAEIELPAARGGKLRVLLRCSVLILQMAEKISGKEHECVHVMVNVDLLAWLRAGEGRGRERPDVCISDAAQNPSLQLIPAPNF
jgi:hypothetical protein